MVFNFAFEIICISDNIASLNNMVSITTKLLIIVHKVLPDIHNNSTSWYT